MRLSHPELINPLPTTRREKKKTTTDAKALPDHVAEPRAA